MSKKLSICFPSVLFSSIKPLTWLGESPFLKSMHLHEAVQVGEDFCSRRYRDEMTSLLKKDYKQHEAGAR